MSHKKFKLKVDSPQTKHKCSFGFEDKRGLYEPKQGERGFSIEKDDWVCSCGKTRREYLDKHKGSSKDVLTQIEKTIFNQGFISREYRKMISDRVINDVKKLLYDTAKGTARHIAQDVCEYCGKTEEKHIYDIGFRYCGMFKPKSCEHDYVEEIQPRNFICWKCRKPKEVGDK